MGDVTIAVGVSLGDFSNEFVALLEQAGEGMLRDMAEDGAALSRAYAPIGTKADPRTRHLKDSITSSSDSESASWEATARHALITEEGGGPSEISGRVNFFWEKEGRRWVPGPNIIHHPATDAQPYLKPALDDIMEKWEDYAKRHYPQ